MKWKIIIIVPSFLLMGCGLSRPALRLIDQTRQAGELAAFDPEASPSTRQAGRDIMANLTEVQKETGKPEDPIPYSPKASADDRQKHQEEQTNPWWAIAGQVAIGLFLGGGVAQQLATRFLPGLLGGKTFSALKSTVEGIARMRDEHGPAGSIPINGPSGLLETLNDVHPDSVKNLILDIAHREEAKLLTKL